jgi:hypothetical protein
LPLRRFAVLRRARLLLPFALLLIARFPVPHSMGPEMPSSCQRRVIVAGRAVLAVTGRISMAGAAGFADASTG